MKIHSWKRVFKGKKWGRREENSLWCAVSVYSKYPPWERFYLGILLRCFSNFWFWTRASAVSVCSNPAGMCFMAIGGARGALRRVSSAGRCGISLALLGTQSVWAAIGSAFWTFTRLCLVSEESFLSTEARILFGIVGLCILKSKAFYWHWNNTFQPLAGFWLYW